MTHEKGKAVTVTESSERTRPSFKRLYMDLALGMSTRSTCARMAVGCVITSIDYRKVIAVGYNGGASGGKNDCDVHGEAAVGACGCFLPGTLVDPSLVERAYRRRYEGELVRVVAGDSNFTATPNHPVLTLGRGWVAAEFLTEGDYLLSSRLREGLASDIPDDKHRVPIEEVFESARESGAGCVRSSGTSHQFHGDGVVDQDVDVVTVDGGLRSNFQTLFLHTGGNMPFSVADEILSFLCGTGSHVAGKHIAGQSTSRYGTFDVTGFNESLSYGRSTDTKRRCDEVGRLPVSVPLGDHTDRQRNHCFSLVTSEILGHLAKDSRFSEAVLNRGVRDVELDGQIENGLSSLVSPHKVRRIDRYRGSSHVYNLQTRSGWFSVAEAGLIVKNCLHAEENAIINCDVPRETKKIVFCTHLPCLMCAKRLINLGTVTRVYFRTDYRKKEGYDLLYSSGVSMLKLGDDE